MRDEQKEGAPYKYFYRAGQKYQEGIEKSQLCCKTGTKDAEGKSKRKGYPKALRRQECSGEKLIEIFR